MLKIRLKRLGRKKRPTYRVVLMNVETKRDGKAIEELGFYNPLSKECSLNLERIQFRVNQGAQLTKTVENLIKKQA